MPTIDFRGAAEARIECPPGANLRVVLLRARLPLYTLAARALHCRGRGTCGTCAVEVEGAVSAPTDAERKRLARLPHRPEQGLRLACQVRVEGDVVVTKHPGLFGHRTEQGD